MLTLHSLRTSGEDSFYLDGGSGKKYFTYITDELPEKLHQWISVLSRKPEDTFIAGLSMGRYGALKIGLTYPERFAGIAALSAVTYPCTAFSVLGSDFDNEIYDRNLRLAFGADPIDKNLLPEHLLEGCVKSCKKIPEIYQYEGKQDILYDMNIRFRDVAAKLGVNTHYEEWDGIHDWNFWDVAIQKALNAFKLKNEVLIEKGKA